MAKGNKSAGKRPVFRPVFIVAAAAMIWGAGHEPGSFDIGTLCAWVIAMATVGLLVQAVLSILVPGFTVLMAWRRLRLSQPEES